MFTKSELLIINHLYLGENKKIAEKVCLAVKTVKWHLCSINKKCSNEDFKVLNKTDLINYLIIHRQGFLNQYLANVSKMHGEIFDEKIQK